MKVQVAVAENGSAGPNRFNVSGKTHVAFCLTPLPTVGQYGSVVAEVISPVAGTSEEDALDRLREVIRSHLDLMRDRCLHDLRFLEEEL